MADPLLARWRFERTIPIVVVCAILGNLGFVVWTVAKFDSRVSDHETRLIKLEEKSDAIHSVNEKLASIQTSVQILLNLNGLDGKYTDVAKPRLH